MLIDGELFFQQSNCANNEPDFKAHKTTVSKHFHDANTGGMEKISDEKQQIKCIFNQFA